MELYDRKATRAAVIDGLRHHLTLAGPEDTALFSSAGHGSTCAVPPELWFLESTARSQTPVCADSRHDEVPDLWDKELSVLLVRVVSVFAERSVVRSDGWIHAEPSAAYDWSTALVRVRTAVDE